MRSKSLRLVFTTIAAGLLLSACQANVTISTKLNASGGGTFSLGVALDREARIGVSTIRTEGTDGTGLRTLTALFDRLRERGWNVATTEPDGGLSFTATRAFRDAAEFDGLLADLRGTDDAAPTPFGSPELKLDFATERSFFRTRSTFAGEFNTAPADASLRKTLQSVRNFIRFEVRTQLPGSIRVEDPSATVVGDTVLWRPQLGSELSFAANSSALRVGSVLIAILPGLLLLSALAWLLLGRRAAHQPRAIIVDTDLEPATNGRAMTNGHVAASGSTPSTIILDPEPARVEQLLAIERDPVDG